MFVFRLIGFGKGSVAGCKVASADPKETAPAWGEAGAISVAQPGSPWGLVAGERVSICLEINSSKPNAMIGMMDFLPLQARSARNGRHEKLLEAEDCDIIGRPATDPNKRALFKKLAIDLRAMAGDIQTVVAGRPI
ncbi:MAG: hypothetical protein ACREEK_20005 [Bradyrhizobium sp.]